MENQDTTKEIKTSPTKRKTIFTVIVAILALAMLASAVYLKFFADNGSNLNNVGSNSASADLSSIIISQKEIPIPLVETDIPSIAYTADAAGLIYFFEFNGKEYQPISATATMDITVSLSNQQIPAKIYYIERDGILTGYGVYTPDTSDADVYIYNFVMFKICNLPESYRQDGKCLLLLHTDRNQAYTADAVWEEAYILNRSDGTSERFLNENNRTVNIQGAVRPDFCMLTNTELSAKTLIVPFFSSRNYEEPTDGSSAKIDIYLKNGKAKDVVAVEDVLDTYAKPMDDGGFVYIKKTDSGFNTVKYQNGQNTIVKMYYATYGSSYIRNGDWILSKEDGRLFKTYDDTVIEPQGYKMNPLLFAVSDDGKYVAMLGTVANAMDYRLYVYNTETGKYKTFNEDNYAAHYNLTFSSSSTISFYTINPSGNYQSVVVDISKI